MRGLTDLELELLRLGNYTISRVAAGRGQGPIATPDETSAMSALVDRGCAVWVEIGQTAKTIATTPQGNTAITCELAVRKIGR